jgi:cell wall-associated NlpC family hydrolase
VSSPPLTVRLAVFVAIAVLLVLATAVGASAEHTAAEKRAQAEAILAEIQVIDEEVGAAAERWNGAHLELDSLTQELAETRGDLARARKHLEVSRGHVAQRLRDLYVNGEGDSTLEVLLGARTLDDVISRLEAVQRIAAQDASIAREAKALRTRVQEREERLAEARGEQAEVVAQLAAEKEAIEARLAERQQLLASVKDEIAQLEEAERRRQAELRRQAQLELQRQQAAAALARVEQQAAVEVAPAVESGSDTQDATPAFDPPPADASRGAQVVAIAMQYLGIPYVWASADPAVGFDCSGLTKYVFAQVGVSLPHYAAAQYQLGYSVSSSELQPGDLVFFRGLGHMGMYIGGGNFIHAPRTGDVVKISSLSESYYVSNWVGARRVL